MPQDTIVCVLWCAHGKHRSVCLAEVLTEKAKAHPGYATVQTVHCEQTRWDFQERARWGESERHFALPLEWMLEQLEVKLDDLQHRICFIHLKGAPTAANRIRADWHAAADKRLPPQFFGGSVDRKQEAEVMIPRRRRRLS
jgi:hypothetical protein